MLYLRNLPKHEVLQDMASRIRQVEPLAIESCLLLLRLAGDLRTLLDESLAKHGTSHGRFTILMLLYRYRDQPAGVLPSELAEWAGVSRATITGLLGGLEDEGLVERLHDPNSQDRRVFSARITEKGKNYVGQTIPEHARLIATLMEPLKDSEKEKLMGLLQKINDALISSGKTQA